MEIKNNIIFSFIFGSFLILFIIWNRLIRTRLPREFIPIDQIDTRTIIVLIITIMFFILTLYYILRLVKIIPKENSRFSRFINYLFTYKWFSNSYEFLHEHVGNGPKNMYEYLYKDKLETHAKCTEYIQNPEITNQILKEIKTSTFKQPIEYQHNAITPEILNSMIERHKDKTEAITKTPPKKISHYKEEKKDEKQNNMQRLIEENRKNQQREHLNKLNKEEKEKYINRLKERQAQEQKFKKESETLRQKSILDDVD